MPLFRHAWGNFFRAKCQVVPILLGLPFMAFAAEALALDSLVKSVADTVSVPSDTVTVDSAKMDSAKMDSAAPLKTVLYLGGGERSPWFQLGVLYAIEEYSIPVDSIVATSWGAWIGALWSRGVPLDDIQKLMLDSTIAPFVGHDLSSPGSTLGYKDDDALELPISVTGIPSVRQRFTLSVDSAHFMERHKKNLVPDSMQVVRALARLRFQEGLYRQRGPYLIPLSVMGCKDGNPELKENSTKEIVASLPLWKSEQDSRETVSGELCPYLALPIEDNLSELPIVVVSDPLRGTLKGDERSVLLKKLSLSQLASQPGVIVRAHTVLDTARNAWIQAGFSSVEKKLSEFSVLKGRRGHYDTARRGAKPWFSYEPAFDSLPSQTHDAVKTYWDKSDTGIVAPRRFAYGILQNPAYDSLEMNMLPSGALGVETSVHPTFDLAAGGFGSNAIGPNAYLEAAMHYVDHVEIDLVLAGFWGGNSYGIQPRLGISKLWNRHWSLELGYDYLNLSPLKSFNGNFERYLRVLNEERSDLKIGIFYAVDARQLFSAEFLFGSRTFEIEKSKEADINVKTYPVSPMLHYRYLSGANEEWFATSGYGMNVWGGFQSIGFDDGIIDVVPIYWRLMADARYTLSPLPILTFTAAAAGAIERYHDEGHGYVSPRSFGYSSLDVAYRLHVRATPWSVEWYNPELSSHEYAMARTSVALHGDHVGAWIFGAYYHDFEDSPYATLDVDKFVLEPALRFAYRSLTIYAGMNRIVDIHSLGDLMDFSDYSYFIRIGNYEF